MWYCMKERAKEANRRWKSKTPKRSFASYSSSGSCSESESKSSRVSVEVTDGSEKISLPRAKAKMSVSAPTRAGRKEWDVAESIDERYRKVEMEEKKSQRLCSLDEVTDYYAEQWIKSERLDGDEDLSNDWQEVVSRHKPDRRERLQGDAAVVLNDLMGRLDWIHNSGNGVVYRCQRCGKWGHGEKRCNEDSRYALGIRSIRIELPGFQSVHQMQHVFLMCC